MTIFLRLSLIMSKIAVVLCSLLVLAFAFSYWHMGLFVFGLPGLYFLVARLLTKWGIERDTPLSKFLVLAYLLLSGIGFPDNPLLIFASPLLVVHVLDLLVYFVKWPKA